MQTRRSLLGTVAGLSALSVAGCLGSDDSEEAYDDALVLLEENAALLDEFADGEETPDEFDGDDIKRRADTADEKLDEAADGLSGDDLEYVDNARAIADYQRASATYNALILEFERCFDTVDAYIDADRFGAANEELDDCGAVLDDLDTHVDDVADAHAAIDPDLIDDDAQLEYEGVSDDLQLEAAELETLERFLDGFQAFLDGSETIVDGFDAFETEAYETAGTQFRDAEAAFEASEETMGRLEADPETPAQFQPDIVEFHCYADAFADASAEYADAATAAEAGNWDDAETSAIAGEDALDRCG